jgi:hypothetical protein
MNNHELTEFQLKCERLLIESLAEARSSISNRTLGGQRETYITGTIEGTDITFWIYDDGADFKSSRGNPIFEKSDYKSLDALAEEFVASILKIIEIERATEQRDPADRL